jgi:hypothetical protein
MLGHSIVSQHFMEPEGSIPNSHELSTCSYPEPDQSSQHHSITPLQDPSQYYPPTYVLVFLVLSFPLADWQLLGIKNCLSRRTAPSTKSGKSVRTSERISQFSKSLKSTNPFLYHSLSLIYKFLARK